MYSSKVQSTEFNNNDGWDKIINSKRVWVLPDMYVRTQDRVSFCDHDTHKIALNASYSS